jgi:hypothetical protein
MLLHNLAQFLCFPIRGMIIFAFEEQHGGQHGAGGSEAQDCGDSSLIEASGGDNDALVPNFIDNIRRCCLKPNWDLNEGKCIYSKNR